MAFIDNEPPDFSGFSQKSDDLAIVRTELGVSNEDINAFYYLAGSKKTIIKVELSAMPCAVLLKKNKTSSGVFWSLFDMGCDDSHED
ncbi:hypothetical protein [Xenorhabdus sp. TH1]|uniref:hypothetical protein n=1 Tax=Xenorhabdus sp. TH1 TaxID=3130166 RepID=UPI0030D086CE